MRRDEQAAREIETAFRTWLEKIPQADVEFFERTLADEWHYTDVSSHAHTKKHYIQLLQGHIPEGIKGELREMDVRVYGDVAVVVGHYTVDIGDTRIQDSRFTAAWVKRDGRWQSVAHQAANISDPIYPEEE
jgi:ketosteroid isomerase-like protein